MILHWLRVIILVLIEVGLRTTETNDRSLFAHPLHISMRRLRTALGLLFTLPLMCHNTRTGLANGRPLCNNLLLLLMFLLLLLLLEKQLLQLLRFLVGLRVRTLQDKFTLRVLAVFLDNLPFYLRVSRLLNHHSIVVQVHKWPPHWNINALVLYRPIRLFLSISGLLALQLRMGIRLRIHVLVSFIYFKLFLKIIKIHDPTTSI